MFFFVVLGSFLQETRIATLSVRPCSAPHDYAFEHISAPGKQEIGVAGYL